jgi:hypothetical protein
MADQTLTENWRFPRWLTILGVILGVLALIALLLFVTGNEDKLTAIIDGIWNVIQSIWLWIVGFAGGILALFQGNGKNKRIGEEKKEIKNENERIGLELEGLRKSMNDVDEWRQRERALHEREIALLERELNLKEQQLKMKEANLRALMAQSGKEYVDNLPEEEREVINDIMEGSEVDL